MSYLSVPIQARHFTIMALGPMESLQISFGRPFPADEEGNTQVLTFKDVEAKHTTQCLILHIGIFGCPSHIVTDCGVQFTSILLRR